MRYVVEIQSETGVWSVRHVCEWSYQAEELFADYPQTAQVRIRQVPTKGAWFASEES